MSMLAGPKKKQQLTLNPRGTLWAKDENKFGQKLLERMGWSKGKGLGKQEQGLHDPLRVSMNDERKGVGFKGNDEGWTKHCDAFEDVLANLSDINSPHGGADIEEIDDGKVDSLELQSKSLKKRVHYKKFTAGKDLSRYNEDDLACVLGSKRASKKTAKEEEVQELEKEEEDTGEVGQMDKSHGLTTIYGGSLKDYFSQKMEELQRKREGGLLGEAGPENRLGSIPDLEFEPSKTNFSFNVSMQDLGEGGSSGGPADSCPPEEEPKEGGKKKKKDKKRKREKQAELEKEAERELEADLKKKSKKRKKREHEQEECDVIEEEGEREGKENKENESAQLDQDASQNKLKKKKKRRREKDIPEEEEENGLASKENLENESKEAKRNEMNHSYVSATTCDEKKKKKKKRKDREGDQEESADSKPLAKLRKLASEVSVVDEKKAKGDPEEEEVVAAEPREQEEAKPNRKLMSKQSFRDFKAELGQKLKKIGKSSDTLSKGALESLFPGSNLATIKGYD